MEFKDLSSVVGLITGSKKKIEILGKSYIVHNTYAPSPNLLDPKTTPDDVLADINRDAVLDKVADHKTS